MHLFGHCDVQNSKCCSYIGINVRVASRLFPRPLAVKIEFKFRIHTFKFSEKNERGSWASCTIKKVENSVEYKNTKKIALSTEPLGQFSLSLGTAVMATRAPRRLLFLSGFLSGFLIFPLSFIFLLFLLTDSLNAVQICALNNVASRFE